MKTFVGSVGGRSDNEVIVSTIIVAVHSIEDGKPEKGWNGKDDKEGMCVELTSLANHNFNMQLTQGSAIRLAKFLLQAIA